MCYHISMKLHKKDFEPLIEAINYPIAKFVEARMRDRIMSKLMEEYKLVTDERTTICVSFCEKDKENKPIIENDNYKFTPENLKKANKEIETLWNEEITINTDVTIGQLKSLVEKSPLEFKVGGTTRLNFLFEDAE